MYSCYTFKLTEHSGWSSAVHCQKKTRTKVFNRTPHARWGTAVSTTALKKYGAAEHSQVSYWPGNGGVFTVFSPFSHSVQQRTTYPQVFAGRAGHVGRRRARRHGATYPTDTDRTRTKISTRQEEARQNFFPRGATWSRGQSLLIFVYTGVHIQKDYTRLPWHYISITWTLHEHYMKLHSNYMKLRMITSRSTSQGYTWLYERLTPRDVR